MRFPARLDRKSNRRTRWRAVTALRSIYRHGAQGRDRTTDTAIFSRMLYQLSYLGTARRRGQGAPVYSQAGPSCPPRFAPGLAWRGHPANACPATQKGRPLPPNPGFGHLPGDRPKTRGIALNRRLRRRPWRLGWRRNSTASGSDRRRGSVRNKTAARPRRPACRRSGRVWPIPWPIPWPTRYRRAG